MQKIKVFILLPDGVGLRNFAFTNFHKIADDNNLDIIYWNSTPFNLTELGYKEIKIKSNIHPLTDLLKRARTLIDLKSNSKKTKDTIYKNYRFPFTNNSFHSILKNSLVWIIYQLNSAKRGSIKVRNTIKKQERKTKCYYDCLETLKTEKPDFVFCTNQRPVMGIAPILAAQDLNIPTATFIFSWDNLPKATMVIEPDFYFVWSDHMKNELLFYYPYIKENQVFVTGTPQFEKHLDQNLLQSKEVFFKENQLDSNKKYICYSGDDITTSPNDPTYLQDTVTAVRLLNSKGSNYGIIFRRCPVDFSNRFDEIIEKNKDVISPLNPKWKKLGGVWNTILPTKEDLTFQINTIYYSEMVINLGSSMVFDFVSMNKPCAFINYDVMNTNHPDWSVKKIYKYVHFRSMPNKDAVIWLNHPSEIAEKIEKGLNNKKQIVDNAQEWFEKINLHPIDQSSTRIIAVLKQIISDSKKQFKE